MADLRRRLAQADAVLFCTPEYAGLLPGSFKNLLDWTVGGGETYGKPVAWINASSRPDPDAGSGAHDTLRTVLGYTGADIAAAACRRIQVPRTALGADGMITDAAIQDEERGRRASADWFMRRPIVSRTPIRAMFGGRCQGKRPMCGVPGGLTMAL